ncbi:hypothetical protein SEA_ROLIET_67 [Mycobacterium phage Roliet]|uniref:Uncharacterized protein n=2 Tax=Pegunavirus soto TaxID=1982928 RepID=A0A3S9UQC6_9CAUD|nr:hypothetical protein SEA_MIKOTA_67 [Mycobacterium phage Mikota]AZS12501.1 hypothetical protein SEA_ROLIET_67 [Mycobacterium phage Roliet]WNM69678.1 helix-turn-helix DNA-binding domain protein [Mycobacterium phage MiniBoss]
MTDTPQTDTDEVDTEFAELVAASIEERRGRVLLMRLAGSTFKTIAQAVGVSIGTVRKDYDIALAAHLDDPPDMMIARQRAVITDIMRANYPSMLNGDKEAAQTILKALDREAKLFGLDAPTRVLAQVNNDDFAVEAARLIEHIQKIDPNELKELARAGQPQQPRPQDRPAAQDTAVEPLDVELAEDGAQGPERDPADAVADTAEIGVEPAAAAEPAAEPDHDYDDWSNLDDDDIA